MLDADGDGGDFGHSRAAVTPCAEDDLEALFGEMPYQQGRENALAEDALGQFFQGIVLEGAAGVGSG
jgi:hypothetical protein